MAFVIRQDDLIVTRFPNLESSIQVEGPITHSRNKQSEYYLTDIVKSAHKDSLKVNGVIVSDSDEVLGVNDRSELSYVQSVLKWRINESLMRSGVTLIDPETTYISPLYSSLVRPCSNTSTVFD